MNSVLPVIGQQNKLFELVSFWQQQTPTAPAIIFDEHKLSYQCFAELIELAAKALLAQGVRKGDVVALYANPSIVFAIQLFACARIGAIWLGLNPKYSAAELSYILDHAKPQSIWLEALSIAEASTQVTALFARQKNVWFSSNVAAKEDTSLEVSSLSRYNSTNRSMLSLASFSAVNLPDLASIDASSPAALIYTSGTTGQPKGAVISQYALTKASIIQANLLSLNAPTILNNLPINHIGSVGDISTSTIANGGCIVMQSKFDVEEGLQLIEQHRVSIWGQIPTMFQMALKHESIYSTDLSSLECILFSGAPASEGLVKQLRALCANVINAYGMSETVGSVTWALNASDETLANTVGKPISQVDLRLGDDSEIQIKSDYCFSYYWNDEAATAEAFTADGYLKTGDVGQQNDDGTITLIGRTKERFKSGGYNVYPREIEIVISNHPKVLDCVVVAVPDQLFHEVGYAFVILKPNETSTQAELQSYCKGLLANFKVPKTIAFVTQFPQLPNGKINKKALAQKALK